MITTTAQPEISLNVDLNTSEDPSILRFVAALKMAAKLGHRVEFSGYVTTWACVLTAQIDSKVTDPWQCDECQHWNEAFTRSCGHCEADRGDFVLGTTT
jgi:hypothetical protein